MKYKSITTELRRMLVSGQFPAGSQLPCRQELLVRFGASVASFQKCINILKEEGFLESRGGSGMYVSDNPPNLYACALLLPIGSSERISLDSVWSAFIKAGSGLTRNGRQVIIKPYYVGFWESAQPSEMERFLTDARNHTLCGAISFGRLKITGVRDDFPLISFDYRIPDPQQNSIHSTTDHSKLFSRCLETLEKLGCRRVAGVFQYTMNNPSQLQILDTISRHRDIYFPSEWLLPMDLRHTDSLFFAQQLEGLFSDNLKRHPDGLIVTNHNFLPLVMRVLAKRGIVCGRDLQIVSHCNIPTDVEFIDNVHYIAFDFNKILSQCLDLFWQFPQKREELLREVVYFEPSPLPDTCRQPPQCASHHAAMHSSACGK